MACPGKPPCWQARPLSGGDAPEGWPFPSWLNIAQAKREAATLGQQDVSTWAGLKDFMDGYLRGLGGMRPPAIYQCIAAGITLRLQLGSYAAVAKGGRGYAIAVDSGSTLQLYNALIRLLAFPGTLKQFRSKPAPRLGRPLALPWLRGDGKVELLFGDNPDSPGVPPDPKLQHYMGGIFTFTHYFLFLHELSHILGGHVERSAEVRRESNEMTRERRETFLRENLEPLEYIADSTSHLLIGALVNTLAAGARRAPDPSIKPDVLAWLTLTGFGIGTLFLLLEAFDAGGGYHPPAAERAMFLRAYAAKPKSRPPGFEHASFEDGTAAIETGFREAMTAWDGLGWKRKQVNWSAAEGESLVRKFDSVSSRLTKPPCL